MALLPAQIAVVPLIVAEGTGQYETVAFPIPVFVQPLASVTLVIV
jgi:hypothetical protein